MRTASIAVLALVCAGHAAFAQEHAGHVQGRHDQPPERTESRRSHHVPPAPPEHPMPEMSNRRMIELMEMDDTSAFGMLLFDQLEWRDAGRSDALAWDAQAWFGDDYNKAWFKSEGSRVAGEDHARTELLWNRILSRWWNVQAGVRHDFNEGPSRTWAAFGVQGLAPYWFDVEATAYVGEHGRTAFRASAESDLLLTQRLILQPEIQINVYGRSDAANGIGAGLSNTQLALRLRYEIRRQLAPYIGVVWTRSHGNTADLARADGRQRSDTQIVAGLRAWF